jgi:tRNA (guanine37-N1)-methyltransferase
MARSYKKFKQIIMIAGRYEGLDERVLKIVDEQLSIGDYVLTGGELPAMVVVDTVARLVPGVVGKEISLAEETFAKKGFIEYPQYTRPEVFEFEDIDGNKKSLRVPQVLLSGDHQKIKKWRKEHSKKR